jgi:ketosteroid isomerase-like protein
MAQDNVEIVKRSFDAIGQRDVDGLLTLYAADVLFLPLTGTQVESGGYRGHAGVRDYFVEAATIWDEVRPYADDIRTTGDEVVVLGGCAVRGKASAVETDSPMAWVVTVRDGLIASHRGYRTNDEALEAAGLEPGA